MVRGLRDADLRVRWGAVQALAACLEDEYEIVRLSAARTLGKVAQHAWLAPGKMVRIDQAALMAQPDNRLKEWLQGVEEADVLRQMPDGRWVVQV